MSSQRGYGGDVDSWSWGLVAWFYDDQPSEEYTLNPAPKALNPKPLTLNSKP